MNACILSLLFNEFSQAFCSFHYYVKLGFSSQHKICLDDAAIVSHTFTSHSIDSCKKLFHHYGEFNNFIGHVLAITEEAIINGESNKEPYKNIKTMRSELESVHKELKISVASRSEEKIIQVHTVIVLTVDITCIDSWAVICLGIYRE
jgi:hypothetical protein